MADAVIVSTARTPIGKAYRGAFNMTHGADLGGHVVKQAVARAGVDPAEVEDVILGCALPERATGGNIARQAAIRAGLPVTVAGMTVNRFCSSGLQAIALAAQRIMTGEASVLTAGGLESISLVQDGKSVPVHDDWIVEHKPAIYMPMIDTADIVAERYKVSREAQDAYALESQRRTATAQQAKRFDDEIVPLPTTKKVVDRNTKAESFEPVTLMSDEGNRPDTTLEGLAALKPVREGKWITAGNASQLSDGASACVVMDGKLAERRGLTPLGTFRGFAVAGCEPDEMGIGPVFAVPKLLARLRAEYRRHRSMGVERGVREPGALLPRPARHSAGATQRRWRRRRYRPSLWHEWRAHDRPRADRRPPARRQARGRHHVRRRRHGRGRVVRDSLNFSVHSRPSAFEITYIVIASEAKQSSLPSTLLDRFVASLLAMTTRRQRWTFASRRKRTHFAPTCAPS